MKSPNMNTDVKVITIDQDVPNEEDCDDAEGSTMLQQPIPIDNDCSQCSSFRANADHAWDVLREFQTKNEENKKYKNEIHQLELQLKESRDYISVLRQQQQNYEKIIIEKDLKIGVCDEKIDRLQDQYSRVLKASLQQQQDYDKIIKEKDLKIKNSDEKIASLDEQNRRLIKSEQQKQHEYDNIIKEKDLKINKLDNKIALLEDQQKQQNVEQQSLQQQQDYDKLVKEKHKIADSNEEIAKSPIKELPKSTAPLEIDEMEDDLFLEIPSSPPVQENTFSQPISIKDIFSSSFFLEHEKLNLIEDLEDFDSFLAGFSSHSSINQHSSHSSQILAETQLPIQLHGDSTRQEIHNISKNYNIDKFDHSAGDSSLHSSTLEPYIPTSSTTTQFPIELTGSTTSLEIRNISKKYNVDKNEAALLFTKAKRDEQRKEQRKRRLEYSDDDNYEDVVCPKFMQKSEQCPRHLLPWMPHRLFVKTNKGSVLSYEDHRRYVGIIVNQLQSIPKYRFEHNKTEIKAMDLKLEDERNFFEKNALQTAKQIVSFNFEPSQLKVFRQHYREIIKLYIGRRVFQGILSSIPWPKNQLNTSISTHHSDFSIPQALHFRTTKILSPGFGPNIQIPDIRRKFVCSNNAVKYMLFNRLKMKLPIDEDKQLVDFALLNDINVSMDACTLRHLLSAPWSQRAQTYACKLKVVSRVFSGKLCTLCIISPPLIASRIHKPSINRAFSKWGLKAHLFGTTYDEQSGPSNQPRDSCQSLLDDLGLSDIGKVDNSKARKRYSIISFDDPKLEDDKQEQYKILIRSSLHANEISSDGQMQQISLTSRAEFIPEIGAEKLTSEEEIWNYVTGLLKGSDEHLNFRLKLFRRESVVLQYDRRMSSKSTSLSSTAKSILISRIQRIKTLIDELSKLSIGEYLLMSNIDDEVLNIIKQKEDSTDEEAGGRLHSSSFEDVGEQNIDNLWESRSRTVGQRSSKNICYNLQWFNRLLSSKIINSSNELSDYWNCIDPHYPLQWHVMKGQIPGALYPKRN